MPILQFAGQQLQCPANAPFGRRSAAQRHEMGLDAAIDLGRNGGREPPLALQRRLFAGQNELLSHTGDGVEMGAQGLRDLLIGVASQGVILIAHQQDASVQDLLGLRNAVASQFFQTLALFG
jgi:hypothetical protein